MVWIFEGLIIRLKFDLIMLIIGYMYVEIFFVVEISGFKIVIILIMLGGKLIFLWVFFKVVVIIFLLVFFCLLLGNVICFLWVDRCFVCFVSRMWRDFFLIKMGMSILVL